MNPTILTFLLSVGCTPTAQVVEVPDYPRMEMFVDGVLYVRPNVPDYVMVHGLVHDCQYQRHGKTKGEGDWLAREAEAKRIESMWREGLSGNKLDDDWRRK